MFVKITKKLLWDWRFWNDSDNYRIYQLDDLFNKSWDLKTNMQSWKVADQIKEMNDCINENLDQNKTWEINAIYSEISNGMFSSNGKFYLQIEFVNANDDEDTILFQFPIYYHWNDFRNKQWELLNCYVL